MYDKHRENLLDQSLADTFPASDAVSIAQPGGGVDAIAMNVAGFALANVRPEASSTRGPNTAAPRSAPANSR